MSKITTGRGKWLTWEPTTNFDGTAATKATYKDWAASTQYEVNDMVQLKSGSGANERTHYYKCRLPHESANGDKSGSAATGASEKGEVLNATKWREVAKFTVISLRSATLTHGTSQQTATDLSEDQDPSISTELTGSVNLEFNAIEEDAVQDTFLGGGSGVCRIYRAGIVEGRRVLSFSGDVSSVGLNIGSDALSIPVTISMDGPLTYGKVTAEEAVGAEPA